MQLKTKNFFSLPMLESKMLKNTYIIQYKCTSLTVYLKGNNITHFCDGVAFITGTACLYNYPLNLRS